jgi:uridine phosphorylase
VSPASQLNWLGTHGDDRPVIDPATHVREMAARRGDNAGTACPELVLASFRSFMVDPLIKATGASPASFHARVSLGLLAARPVAVARFEIGAPASVMLFEELIGLGARTLLLAGATGSLQPDVTVGSYVVATSALREEGTSLHYVSPDHRPSADGAATGALIAAARASDRAVHAGRLWTTDAPYREFAGKVRAYAAEGVLGVDMETSALMTLAEYRGVDIGILLTVSDHVFDPDWQNIFGTDEYHANCRHMAGVLVAAAQRLIAETSGD